MVENREDRRRTERNLLLVRGQRIRPTMKLTKGGGEKDSLNLSDGNQQKRKKKKKKETTDKVVEGLRWLVEKMKTTDQRIITI